MSNHPIAFGCSSLAEGRRLLALAEDEYSVHRETVPVSRELLLDTFDGRIEASGAVLSAAEMRNGPLVLHWRTDDGRPLHRVAVETLPRFASDLPESPFRKALSKLTDIRCLIPLAELNARRIRLAVEDGRQKTVTQLILEHGTVAEPGEKKKRRRLPVTLRIVTIRGYDAAARRLARFLERHGARPATSPRLRAALEVLGSDAARQQLKPAFDGDPNDTADRATRRILGFLLDTVRSMEDGVRRDLDTEFLHDFRVAVRRARSLLGQLVGVLPRREVKQLVKDLKWLARSTNAMRDLDVYLLNVPDYRTMLPEARRSSLDPLEAFLRERRGSELGALQAVLAGDRYASTLRRWKRIARGDGDAGPFDSEGARPIRDVAAERIQDICRKVLAKGRAIDDDSPADDLHRLRIGCKKLRYLLEFFGDTLDADRLAKPIKALKRLQDNLGRFNDLDVQQATLERLSGDVHEDGTPDAATEQALAELVELLGEQQRGERARFGGCFSKFDAPAMRRHLARGIDLEEIAIP